MSIEEPRPIEVIRLPDLAGRRILVTGASTGIGSAVARSLATQGAHVAVHYNASVEPALALIELITAAGGSAIGVQGDLSVPGECERVVREAAEKLGGLDGLINNAGGMLGRVPALEQTDSHYDAVMDLNARSVLSCTRAAHPFLKESRGFIINTTSIAARTGGGPGSTLYAAAKGFVSTMTHGHAREFAADGIRVNAVSPGTITTPFHERYSSPAHLDAARAAIPQGRLGTAEDCVGAFLFFASEALAGYVTGQILEVNGGQLMP